jgi:hypothetical protein
MRQQTLTSHEAQPSTPITIGVLQRKCECGNHTIAGGECRECGKNKRFDLQTKLKVSEPGDVYEQEADRIADQVTATPTRRAVDGAAPRIRRFAGQPAGRVEAGPASVDRALAGYGRPLEPALRQDMEQRFGYDFSKVRVHTGATAEQSARDVNAQAYTVGHDIVFGAGRFTPGTHEGRRLIAHELTHVAQQSDAGIALFRQGGEKSPSNLYIPPMEQGRNEGEDTFPGGAKALSTWEECKEKPAGPECSRCQKRSKDLPFSISFDGERGFAYIPSDGHPGPGGVTVDGNAVTIEISAQWIEQIENPNQRPPDQRNRRADSPQYYLSFNGWVDECGAGAPVGRPASSVTSGNLAIGKKNTVSLKNLRPGRYGLEVNPSTASAEPNRVLSGKCEIKAG